MSTAKLLLCTDMDRTVIPNGAAPEAPDARQRLRAFCAHAGVTLVYVSGRHRVLVQQAISEYALPPADFVISDVGTRIYQVSGDEWHELEHWAAAIAKDWNGLGAAQLQALLSPVEGLQIQEASKQNTHKLSYYVPLSLDKDRLMDALEARLATAGIAATLVWSIDDLEDIGLLDVLPRSASKLQALEFLHQELGYDLSEVVFAGDSGNDLPVLGSRIHAVLVANASAEIKQAAQQLAAQSGHTKALYVASDNYAAGVLQGIAHFSPAFRDAL